MGFPDRRCYGDIEGQLKTALWDVCVLPREKAVPWDDDSGNHWFVADWESELESFSFSIDYDGRQKFYELSPWNRQREMSFIYADAAFLPTRSLAYPSASCGSRLRRAA